MIQQEHLKRLKELNLPEVFTRIWEGNGPRRMRGQWEPPIWYLRVASEFDERFPILKSAAPILESNQERTIFFEPLSKEFLLLEHTLPELMSVGKSYQQFLAWLFSEFVFAGLLDFVRDVASEFQFNHMSELETYAAEDDQLESSESQRRFVASIAD